MRFILIDPTPRTVGFVEADDIRAIKSPCIETIFRGPYGADHGVLTHFKDGTMICLFVRGDGLLHGSGPYFALHQQLMAGPCVLYRADRHGVTIPIESNLEVSPLWLPDPESAETAIRAGFCHRPYSAINGVKLNEWRSGTWIGLPEASQ